jgi:transposase
MWKSENRAQYSREGLRYPTDLTDAEWSKIEPIIPPARPGGNKRTVDIRQVTNGLMFILGSGCQWRAIPKDLPHWRTIYDYLDRWNHDGTLERLHHALYVECRELAGRGPSPTAAVIDSQSVKSAEKGGSRLTRRGMTRGRKSKVSSGTFSSTRQV